MNDYIINVAESYIVVVKIGVEMLSAQFCVALFHVGGILRIEKVVGFQNLG